MPWVSSMIEGFMREPGRRIKNIAYGWSDNGVTKIARVILRRFANAKEWEGYWNKVFGDDLSVVILLKNLKGNLPKRSHLFTGLRTLTKNYCFLVCPGKISIFSPRFNRFEIRARHFALDSVELWVLT